MHIYVHFRVVIVIIIVVIIIIILCLKYIYSPTPLFHFLSHFLVVIIIIATVLCSAKHYNVYRDWQGHSEALQVKLDSVSVTVIYGDHTQVHWLLVTCQLIADAERYIKHTVLSILN